MEEKLENIAVNIDLVDNNLNILNKYLLDLTQRENINDAKEYLALCELIQSNISNTKNDINDVIRDLLK